MSTDYVQLQKDFALEQQKRREQAKEKRKVLAAELTALGITSVHIEYNGEGDDGCIESIDLFRGSELVADGSIKCDAIHDLAYDVLEQEHCGWEINEGSMGTIEWNLQTNKLTIEHAERMTSYEESTIDL